MVAIEPETNPEKILKSSYPAVALPKLTTASAVEFILGRSRQNVEKGLVDFITDSATGEKLTRLDIEPQSKSVASAFAKRGMIKGDVAIYLTSNVTRIYTLVIGVWRTGGIVYSSYPEETQDTLVTRIRESKAKWLICDPISVPQCRAAKAQVDWPMEIFVFGESEGATPVDELFADDGSACPERTPCSGLDDPILVLCTSGTTGRSKGAVYTNKSVLGFCVSMVGMPESGRNMLLLTRPTHVGGLLIPLRCACADTKLVLMSQLTKQNMFTCVQEYKPIFAYGFPTFLLLLAVDPEASNYDLSSLELICTGGMIVTESFYTAFKRLPNVRHVLNGFGMTECGVLATTIDLASRDFRRISDMPPMTIGKLLPNTDLKIMDVDTGKALGPMEKGEMAFRNPIMASCYLNQPEETTATFVDGWMKTGDYGYYDDEGFVFVVDRIKEAFKYFNNHISPAEIENEIVKFPAVAEACVFGIVDPNGGDRIPRALVTLKKGQSATADEIKEFADQSLAEYKKIRGGLYIVESLPKGKTGKILKTEAAKLLIPL